MNNNYTIVKISTVINLSEIYNKTLLIQTLKVYGGYIESLCFGVFYITEF